MEEQIEKYYGLEGYRHSTGFVFMWIPNNWNWAIRKHVVSRWDICVFKIRLFIYSLYIPISVLHLQGTPTPIVGGTRKKTKLHISYLCPGGSGSVHVHSVVGGSVCGKPQESP